VTLRLRRRRSGAESADHRDPSDRRTADVGTVLLAMVVLAFLLIALPVIVKGEPLADDYYSCVRHTEVGLSGALHQSLVGTGAVRPARFLEILLLASLCGRVPFGLLMLVPLGLTLTVAFLLRGLIQDLGAARPWPEAAAALWLLAPLGAESALWPSALHVPLGLALALGSLRMYRRERYVLGGALALAAFLSLEQALFAMPLAAFLVTPKHKVKSLLTSGSIALVVLIAFATWPGQNERTAVSLSERVSGIVQDPLWYVKFPVAGLGVHSIPLAVWWALPFSVAILAVGGWLGMRLGRSLPGEAVSSPSPDERPGLRILAATAVLAVLINLPQMATVPRGVSGRIFAPTWLLLAGSVALIADRTRAPRAGWFWAGAGIFGAGAVLSLALCVDVRLHTADFTEASSAYIAARLSSPNEVVAVCGIERTVVTPAPVGSFAINEFIYDWSAQYALKYDTGKSAVFLLGGPLWGTRCPDLAGADLVVRFQQLRTAAGLGG
jgi:hypothetical protein